jgi:hypothetical protein
MNIANPFCFLKHCIEHIMIKKNLFAELEQEDRVSRKAGISLFNGKQTLWKQNLASGKILRLDLQLRGYESSGGRKEVNQRRLTTTILTCKISPIWRPSMDTQRATRSASSRGSSSRSVPELAMPQLSTVGMCTDRCTAVIGTRSRNPMGCAK